MPINVTPTTVVNLNVSPDGTLAFGPPPTPDASKSTPEESGDNFYTYYKIETLIEEKSGLLQLPVAGPGTDVACSLIRVHAPMGKKVVAWTAERFGDWPTLPHWDTGTDNEAVLDKKIIPQDPTPTADGSGFLFAVSGVYTYALGVPLRESDPIPAGVSPADSTDPSTYYIAPYRFDKRLLRYAAGPTPGGSFSTSKRAQ